jgi:acyl-CoA reductase-like NAD-dependent aldehyde dehydrogenase
MKTLPTQPFIDGKFCPGQGQRIPQINPATEEILTEVEGVSEAQVTEAVHGAQLAFTRGWRDLPAGKRTDILFRIAAGIRARQEELAQWESANIGKPISDARDEIALGARIFEYYAGAITKLFGHTVPVARGGFDFTLRQPMGVVAAIVPWNFPFPIACWKVAPALAAGNCVVLKPASQSPFTALGLASIAAEAGLPAGGLQVIPGSGALVGDALVTHPVIRKISFTGSTEIGSRIMALAAPQLKRVSLELGGKSPNIVFADADWEQAAATSPMSVFGNTGQDCCARSRVFVERAIFERFTEKFIAATRAIRVGDPADAATQVGPLVSAAQRQTVETFLEEARKQGRQVVLGGDRPWPRGYFLNPAVVLGAEPQDRIWREEVFGPAVCLRSFDDEASLLAEVNESRYGLSGSIWTTNLSRALRIARAVESGVLSINSHSSVHVEAPFGGMKQSGLGRDLGMAALEGYTELKNVYVAE